MDEYFKCIEEKEYDECPEDFSSLSEKDDNDFSINEDFDRRRYRLFTKQNFAQDKQNISLSKSRLTDRVTISESTEATILWKNIS